jgi:hypothetical protein
MPEVDGCQQEGEALVEGDREGRRERRVGARYDPGSCRRLPREHLHETERSAVQLAVVAGYGGEGEPAGTARMSGQRADSAPGGWAPVEWRTPLVE